MSLGRIGRVKRCRWPSASTRRSSMRGAPPSKVPLPVTRCRAGALPLRTTCARPRSSRASRCRRMYSSPSASSASCSIFSAPRCRSSSSVVPSSSFSLVGFSTPPAWVASPSPGCEPGVCVWNSHEGYAAFCHSADPQHSVISPTRSRICSKAWARMTALVSRHWVGVGGAVFAPEF